LKIDQKIFAFDANLASTPNVLSSQDLQRHNIAELVWTYRKNSRQPVVVRLSFFPDFADICCVVHGSRLVTKNGIRNMGRV